MQITLSSARYLLAIVLTSLVLTACDSEPESTEAEVIVRPVKMIQLGETNITDFLNYPAVIKSQHLSELSFEVSGVLEELLVVEAQTVKKGDVLAKLDQQDLKTKLKSARSQYDNAAAEYKRAQNLMKEDAISRSTVDKRKSTSEVSKAKLDTAEKALRDSVLVAPYDGSIAKIFLEDLQAVQAGEKAIKILGQGLLEATINLPASVIARSGKSRVPATDSYIILNAASELRIPAAFKEASLEADEASQTYEVVFSFAAPDGLIILPGMNAVVWFRDPDKSGSDGSKIRIPLTAIAANGDQQYVWVVDQSTMLVWKRNIEIEASVGSLAEVSNGLQSGETIVASGVSLLSEGMKVSKWTK